MMNNNTDSNYLVTKSYQRSFKRTNTQVILANLIETIKWKLHKESKLYKKDKAQFRLKYINQYHKDLGSVRYALERTYNLVN